MILDSEMTETGVQELLRKHSSVAASSGGGTTTPSLLPTLNERMSDRSVNDGFVKDLQFVAKTKKKSDDTILLSGGGEEGGSGTKKRLMRRRLRMIMTKDKRGFIIRNQYCL